MGVVLKIFLFSLSLSQYYDPAYRHEGVRYGVTKTGEEIGDGEHEEGPVLHERPHV